MGLGRLLVRSAPAEHTRAEPGEMTLADLLADTGAPTAAGVPVTPDRALALPAVWAAARLLADSVAMLPLDVYRGGEQVDPPRLLVEPAAGLALPEWLGQVMYSLLLRGNAYGVVVARSGRWLTPAQVELVNPDAVTVLPDEHGVPVYRVGGQVVDRHDVWHVRAHTMPGQTCGMSPIRYARETIGLGLAAERFGAEFFGSGAVPSAIIKSLDPTLGPEEAQALKAAWLKAQRTRQPMVMNAATEFSALSIAPEEAQFIESARWNVAQVARVFGVPAEMIGGESGGSLTYSNTEARALDFVRYSLGPWVVRLEAALGRLVPAGHRVRFNPDALLRGTTSERYAAHASALAAGWLTVAEVRALEDLPPLRAGGAAA